MIKYERENDCVGCDYCVNCGRKEDYFVPILTCDSCGKEVDKLYEFEGGFEICAECVLEHFDEIDEDEALERLANE